MPVVRHTTFTRCTAKDRSDRKTLDILSYLLSQQAAEVAQLPCVHHDDKAGSHLESGCNAGGHVEPSGMLLWHHT